MATIAVIYKHQAISFAHIVNLQEVSYPTKLFYILMTSNNTCHKLHDQLNAILSWKDLLTSHFPSYYLEKEVDYQKVCGEWCDGE